jgi:hypothetical protein
MTEREAILTEAIQRFNISTPATSTEVVLHLDKIALGPDAKAAREAREYLRKYDPRFTIGGRRPGQR